MPSPLRLRDRARAFLAPGVAPQAPRPPSPHPRPHPHPRRDGAAPGIGRRVDSIANMLTGLGTAEDKATWGEPDLLRYPMTSDYLDALYRFNHYAGMFVDRPAQDATRRGWRVVDDTEDRNLVQDEDKRLKTKARIAEAIRWGRQRGSCVLLIVTTDRMPAKYRRDPAAWLKEPLDPARVESVDSLIPLVCTDEAFPYLWRDDLHDPDFREPELWYVNPITYGGNIRGLHGGSGIVHCSRLIHFGGRPLSWPMRTWNYGLDDSVLEQAWDAIRNITSADQAMAVLVHEFKIDVLKMAGLANVATGTDGQEKLQARMKQIAQGQSILNKVLLGEGEEYKTQHTPMSGIGDLLSGVQGSYSSATNQPKAMVYGEPPSGLATDGESWQAAWSMVTAAYQEVYLRDKLERLYEVILGARKGPTNGRHPKEWRIEFEPLDQPTETKKGENRKRLAETLRIFWEMQVVDSEAIAKALFGEKGEWSDVLTLQEEDIEEDAEHGPEEEPEEAGSEQDPRVDGVDPSERFKLPAAARNNASKVIQWREDHPDEIRGMTDSGWRTARTLAKGGEITGELVNKMSGFNRHGADFRAAQRRARNHGEPWTEPAIVAWNGWGGTSGVNWARKLTGAVDGG